MLYVRRWTSALPTQAIPAALARVRAGSAEPAGWPDRRMPKSKMARGGSDLTTDEAEKLIEAIKERPSIYDMGSIEYRDSVRKENALEAVRIICGFKTAPLELSSPESLLMGMVESLDKEEPAAMTQQANTDFLAAESPESSSSTPSDRGHSRVPEPRIAKRKKDQDRVEQELLRHLSTKMTGSEALGYSIGAAIQHWDTQTYALFSADVHRLIAEYEVPVGGFKNKGASVSQIAGNVSRRMEDSVALCIL
ncbi:hypothetical protein HPB47_005534 [Ixodes persulcatus]|uniref:Uncharacterized protein n=1 Tax=Ixodes persulcatus TaxID=34615 RepID=A0AC60PE02_IXOPE|nr:hypothetical protein HPB47_005534 [Ixodes persulcatus]